MRHPIFTKAVFAAILAVVIAMPFAACAAGEKKMTLTSDAGIDGGTLPVEYTCDGEGATVPLAWSNVPAGTREFALLMTTRPPDGSTRWNWILYGIPGTATGLAKNGSAAGVLGTGDHGTTRSYDPPCPKGPGAKTYTFTLYALSASPKLPGDPDLVTGPVLAEAIAPVTLGSGALNLNFGRTDDGGRRP